MAWWDKYQLPDSPPALDYHINLTADEAATAQQLVDELSEELRKLPVVLSQHGAVYAAAGCSAGAATDIALAVHLIWKQQAHRRSREVIRFPSDTTRAGAQAVPLVSLHVIGGITLSVVWRGGQTLNRIRTQTAATQDKLYRWLSRAKAAPGS
jgi:hypothetical protein